MSPTESSDASPPTYRSDFRVLRSITTRWHDNDHYGHVNNVVYYAYFDTAVNGFLIEASGTDIRDLSAIGIVAETSCRFLRELSFPDTVHAGLALEKLGNSSVVYRATSPSSPAVSPMSPIHRHRPQNHRVDFAAEAGDDPAPARAPVPAVPVPVRGEEGSY